MAQIEIIEKEGLRLARLTLDNETVRTEAGALYYMHGPITMESKAPGVGGFLKAVASRETIFRPTYTGTGELYLEPSFGGFHTIELTGREESILEEGCYYASESTVEVGVHREKALTAFKSGEGFLDFQTKVSGTGKVLIGAPGPVEELVVKGKLVVDGKYVVGRPAGMGYQVSRATKSLFGSMTSGEGLVRTYEGTGKVLFSPMPYWRQRLFQSLSGTSAGGTSR